MPPKDYFENHQRALSSPARDAFPITPNDGQDLEVVTRAIYVGGSGDLEVVMLGGATVTFVGLSAGAVLPCSVSRVRQANTTATDLIGLV